ncbi:MAG: cupin domain-containing protein [Chlorobi bacterium]|nr:cupin domain-containing protein [Chlorobiota bacterium]
MKIERKSLKAIKFDGLEIRDYTAELDGSSSMAEITVPAGAQHKLAWSKRSDKYYYVIEGRISFTVDDLVADFSAGDACIIRQGVRFSYENKTGVVARVLLVHTPSFVLAEEVFEE